MMECTKPAALSRGSIASGSDAAATAAADSAAALASELHDSYHQVCHKYADMLMIADDGMVRKQLL